MSYDLDLFVIGAGSGGVRASRIASSLGAKVAVAEDLYLGGTCVNVGCVPKKLFVYGSHFSDDFQTAKGFGWNLGATEFNWQTLRSNKDNEIKRLNGIYHTLLRNAGVDIIDGRATILDPHTVQVGERRFTAERILIATGGWPRRPSFPGAEHVITSNEAFYLDEFPKSVLVQGGGYIAVEFAGIFAGFGASTEMLYRGDCILRGFDEDVRTFVQQEMGKKSITLSLNNDIASIVKRDDSKLEVTLEDGTQRVVDCVMSAIGRNPKTDGLGVENTQVKRNKNGTIEVNEHFQTAEPSIYAIGDVIGRMALTPVALAEGMALARYLYNGQSLNLDYANIPTAVFCQPNIGTVGLTEAQARQEYPEIEVYKSEFTAMKYALSEHKEKTLMKLLVDKKSRKVLGCHMVGQDAGEIIQGIAIAIKAGATKDDFDTTIGIHPTSAEEFVTMRQPVS